jgi:hypothetical protein
MPPVVVQDFYYNATPKAQPKRGYGHIYGHKKKRLPVCAYWGIGVCTVSKSPYKEDD